MEAFYNFLQSSDLGRQLLDLWSQIYETLIYADRWTWYMDGLIMTLKLTVGAILVGTVLGIIAAVFSISKFKLLRFIAGVYTTVIRGTPTTVQLLIMYNVILVSTTNKLMVGILAFGINSGAYIAEILRGGIVSVDSGQTEAGRSLGLSSAQTMLYIILPQAIKISIPTYTSEFIVLFKETSIAGMIAVVELTKVANNITSQTYNAMVPLFVSALIYLAVVMLLTFVFGKLERRLRKSDAR